MYPLPARPCAGIALACLWLLAACGEPATEGVSSAAAAGLVLVRFGDGAGDLHRVRIADGAEQRITRTPGRDERWPYWSDAAGRLLFQATTAGRRNDLFLWDPVTGEESQLVATPQRDERWQRWSPDGARVAYAFRDAGLAAGIETVELATGERSLVAASSGQDYFLRPRFLTDGQRLVAQRRGLDGRGSWLWRLHRSAPPERLTEPSDWFEMKAEPTRDGSHLVYTRRRRGSQAHEIARIPVAGGRPRSLLGSGPDDAHSASPSPTRDEIAFVWNRDGSYDLFLADLTGADLRPLTRSPERSELAPRWSPDGELILATVTPAGAGRPRLGDAEALARTRVIVLDRSGRLLLETPGAMADWMPAWP